MANQKIDAEGIRIGSLVTLGTNIKILEFDDKTLKVEILNDDLFNIKNIEVPRALSTLGQFLPGQNWRIPKGNYTLLDDFEYTGRYSIGDELFVAEQASQEDLDLFLYEYINQELTGGIIVGRVVYIYATYIYSTESKDDDIEFFDTAKDALQDHYAYEVYCVIQDLSSNVEFSINLKLLKML